MRYSALLHLAGMGCVIIATGIPIYLICVMWKTKPKSFTRFIGMCQCRIFSVFPLAVSYMSHLASVTVQCLCLLICLLQMASSLCWTFLMQPTTGLWSSYQFTVTARDTAAPPLCQHSTRICYWSSVLCH